MNDNFKVGIYLRLSREDDGLGESESITTQRDLLMNYIRDNSLLFIDEYVDDGVSGTTFDRAGFNRMIKDCESKRINMIITKDTSRLGRDHIEFGYYVERYFPEHNIRYVAVNDGIDTFNSNSNDMLLFKSAFNDMYVKDISNKLRSALYTKKRNGLFVGCYAPYGYKKNPQDSHKLEIDEEASDVVKHIFNLFVNGNSIPSICESLTRDKVPTPSMHKNMKLGQVNIHYGVWSTRTVAGILKNQIYIGNLVQCKQKKINYKTKKRINNSSSDWIVVKDVVKPIIDNKTFEIVQNMFKINSNRSKKCNDITQNILLRGLIVCKECGHTIGFRDHPQNTLKYGLVHRVYGNCNYWSKRKKQKVCTPHFTKYQEVEDLIINTLKRIVKERFNKDRVDRLAKELNNRLTSNKNYDKELNDIERQIIIINKKIDICYNDKLDGNISIDVYKRTYENLLLEIDRCNDKKKILMDKISSNNEVNYSTTVKDICSFKKISKALISLLIDKIEIDEDKNIDLYFKFV